METTTAADDGLCAQVTGRVRDGILVLLPVPVVEHLAEANRHLAAAAGRLAELQAERADRWVARARELNPPKAPPPPAEPAPEMVEETLPAAD